jgi:hypothetical protein
MTSYQVMSWRGIPSQVKATDEDGITARRQMPPFFQQEIDRVAMAEGLIDSDAYLDEWDWSATAVRDGSAEEVAEAVALDAAEAWQRANHPEGSS